MNMHHGIVSLVPLLFANPDLLSGCVEHSQSYGFALCLVTFIRDILFCEEISHTHIHSKK